MKIVMRIMVFSVVMAFLFLGFGCATKTVQKEGMAQPETAAKVEQKPEPVAPPPPPVEEKKAPEAPVIVEQKAPAKEVQEVKEVKPEAKEEAPKVTSLESIHFDFDKYNIRPPDREILARHAEWLKKNKNARITIEGHCDERGTVEYNLALGERRANAAKKYLVSLGVEAERIKTISYGKERPIDSRHNEEAWAKNRRAEFVIEYQ